MALCCAGQEGWILGRYQGHIWNVSITKADLKNQRFATCLTSTEVCSFCPASELWYSAFWVQTRLSWGMLDDSKWTPFVWFGICLIASEICVLDRTYELVLSQMLWKQKLVVLTLRHQRLLWYVWLLVICVAAHRNAYLMEWEYCLKRYTNLFEERILWNPELFSLMWTPWPVLKSDKGEGWHTASLSGLCTYWYVHYHSGPLRSENIQVWDFFRSVAMRLLLRNVVLLGHKDTSSFVYN